MGWLLRECFPEVEKRLNSFLAPNMSQKNHSFWKIKNRVVLPVGFSFSHLLPPYPAPITVFNCWKWGHSGSGLNCLGLRMEVMWSAWSHRVAPDLNPQPLGNKTIWKVFSYCWFFFFSSWTRPTKWSLPYCGIAWLVTFLILLPFWGKCLRMLLNSWCLKSCTWTQWLHCEYNSAFSPHPKKRKSACTVALNRFYWNISHLGVAALIF